MEYWVTCPWCKELDRDEVELSSAVVQKAQLTIEKRCGDCHKLFIVEVGYSMGVVAVRKPDEK